MYPKMLPKGTIIEIGDVQHRRRSAVGVQFMLHLDVGIRHNGLADSAHTYKVIKNPNGWESTNVYLYFDLNNDKVIYSMSTNEEAIHLLHKEW